MRPIARSVPVLDEAPQGWTVCRVLMPGADSWTALLIKALATALVVTLASALVEAAGPVWEVLAASLPVSAGPTYVFWT